MKKFVAVSPYSKIPEGLYPIDCAPGPGHEVYLFSKSKDVSFDEVIHILLHSFSKTDLLGAASLIYYKYYNEFCEFILRISGERKYKWAIKRFYRQYLIKWSEFLKYSDDTACPQNAVIRNIIQLIKERYF